MCPPCKQLCVPVREITNLEEHSFVLTVFTFLDLQSEGLSNLATLSSLAVLSSLASLGQFGSDGRIEGLHCKKKFPITLYFRTKITDFQG